MPTPDPVSAKLGDQTADVSFCLAAGMQRHHAGVVGAGRGISASFSPAKGGTCRAWPQPRRRPGRPGRHPGHRPGCRGCRGRPPSRRRRRPPPPPRPQPPPAPPPPRLCWAPAGRMQPGLWWQVAPSSPGHPAPHDRRSGAGCSSRKSNRFRQVNVTVTPRNGCAKSAH